MFFRRNGKWAIAAAFLFAIGLVGACLLVLIYHSPFLNILVHYFVTRPGFIWFGMLFPLLIPAFAYMRVRWLLAGCALWLVALCACDDGYKVIKPGVEEHRLTFQSARDAHWTIKHSDRIFDPATMEIPLRVLTWNVRNGTLGARELIVEIAAQKADIVVMQEFAWGSDETMLRAVREAPELAEWSLQPDFKFALLSRFPLKKVKSDFLPAYNHSVWDVEVLPSREFRFIIVHLPPQDLKTQLVRGWTFKGLMGAVLQNRNTLNALQQAVLAAPGQLVVAGDFNLSRYYPHLGEAMPGLKDAFSEEGFGWGKTAPAKLPAMRIDMIYVPEDADVMACLAVPTRHSDHFGAMAEFMLPPLRQN